MSALVTAFLALGLSEVGSPRETTPGAAEPPAEVASNHAQEGPWRGPSPHCSHIAILEGEQDRQLANGMMFEHSATLIRPGPLQLAATQAALSRMTPLLCQSVGRIAFGHIPNNKTLMGAVNSFGAGDLILINTGGELDEASLERMISRRLFLQRTIIHEAGHSAETLINLESSTPPQGYVGAWGTPARAMATRAIENARLESGLTNEWKRLHRSFVNYGWAVNYPSRFEDPEARKQWTRRQVTDGGFMSWGGSRNWAEDIASFIGSTYLSQTITEAYREHGVSEDLREDLGCQQMQAYEERNLPARFAAIYTKLLFLQDLGLVNATDVRACMGDSLGLPIDGAGFEIWQGTHQLMRLSDNLTAGIGAHTLSNRVFEMKGSGEAGVVDKKYPATLRLELDLGQRFDDIGEVSWPRGIYKLGSTSGNKLEVRIEGAKQGSFDAMDGFTLVTQASNDRITGSIVLYKVLRSHAPKPVPELFDPPLVVRFMIEK